MEYRKIGWGKRNHLSKIETYNKSNVVKPLSNWKLINGTVYKLIKKDRRTGMAVVVNNETNKHEYILQSDYLRKGEDLYGRKAIAALLNRTLNTLFFYEEMGLVPKYHCVFNIKGKPSRYVLTLEEIKTLRNTLLENRRGQAVPNDAELTRRAGQGMILYTTSPEGNMIPVWSESL